RHRSTATYATLRCTPPPRSPSTPTAARTTATAAEAARARPTTASAASKPITHCRTALVLVNLYHHNA
ncbi:hypothetical protein K525DRAFT_216168, partial [Schizophyllum commune Loenen D]